MNDTELVILIKKIADETYNHWVLNKTDEDKNSNPKNIKEAFEQACLVIEHIGNLDDQLKQDDREDLCNHYIQVFFEIIIWIEKLKITGIERDAKTCIIYYAAWSARIGAKLNDMDKIANIMGEYANHCKEPNELEELALASLCILDAVPKKLQMQNKADDNRPWRIILLNNAIVATRSFREDLIEKAFKLIGDNLPDDAPAFFANAAKQMETKNYPDDVANLVNYHYDLWNDDDDDAMH